MEADIVTITETKKKCNMVSTTWEILYTSIVEYQKVRAAKEMSILISKNILRNLSYGNKATVNLQLKCHKTSIIAA